MSSSASDLLKFEKQGTGDNSGTWGTKANTAMSRIEEAIADITNISLASLGGANYTLNDTQYAEHSDGSNTSESHCAVVKATGTLTAAEKIIVPLRNKRYLIWNATGGAYAVTVGGATGGIVTVPQGFLQEVVCDGTNVEAVSAPCDVDGLRHYPKGGDIASASPLVIDTDGEMFDVTGTTGFSAMTVSIGRLFVLQFDGALTMTHGAGTLDLLGAENITTAAGDTGLFYSTAANVVRMIGWISANGFASPGKQTIWIPTAAMRPTVSNGCAALVDVETTADRPDMQVLDFDATADEHAQFQIFFPKSWDEGTVTFRAVWTTTATDTDGVTWALQGVAVGDGDTIDVAYGTAVTVDDAGQSTAEDLYLSPESGAITIAGSPAVDQLCYFRVFRDVSDANDTATEDARLIGVRIIFTTDTGNDD